MSQKEYKVIYMYNICNE